MFAYYVCFSGKASLFLHDQYHLFTTNIHVFHLTDTHFQYSWTLPLYFELTVANINPLTQGQIHIDIEIKTENFL